MCLARTGSNIMSNVSVVGGTVCFLQQVVNLTNSVVFTHTSETATSMYTFSMVSCAEASHSNDANTSVFARTEADGSSC